MKEDTPNESQWGKMGDMPWISLSDYHQEPPSGDFAYGPDDLAMDLESIYGTLDMSFNGDESDDLNITMDEDILAALLSPTKATRTQGDSDSSPGTPPGKGIRQQQNTESPESTLLRRGSSMTQNWTPLKNTKKRKGTRQTHCDVCNLKFTSRALAPKLAHYRTEHRRTKFCTVCLSQRYIAILGEGGQFGDTLEEHFARNHPNAPIVPATEYSLLERAVQLKLVRLANENRGDRNITVQEEVELGPRGRVGRIDLWVVNKDDNSTEIVEIKQWKAYKHAMGQIMWYWDMLQIFPDIVGNQVDFTSPLTHRSIFFFGEKTNPIVTNYILAWCKAKNINVYWSQDGRGSPDWLVHPYDLQSQEDDDTQEGSDTQEDDEKEEEDEYVGMRMCDTCGHCI